MAGDGKPYHFTSRFFAPWVGIDEDPVTGSAHAVLGPYWAKRLHHAPGTMSAKQCSARGGELLVRVEEEAGRVVVAGQVTIISKGHLILPTPLLNGHT